jgi:hypothetical protein
VVRVLPDKKEAASFALRRSGFLLRMRQIAAAAAQSRRSQIYYFSGT